MDDMDSSHNFYKRSSCLINMIFYTSFHRPGLIGQLLRSSLIENWPQPQAAATGSDSHSAASKIPIRLAFLGRSSGETAAPKHSASPIRVEHLAGSGRDAPRQQVNLAANVGQT